MKKSLIVFVILICIPAFIYAQAEVPQVNKFLIDNLWIIVSAALVFFMQAGFLALEVGFVRRHSITGIALKNGIDFLVGSLGFFLAGFALMFGTSSEGLVGFSLFGLQGLTDASGGHPLGHTFFIFQLGFAVTAITIVSGALAERVGFISYLAGALVVGTIIYPIFGHWAWGNAFFGENKPWLAELGFMDFAGSTVVHSIGGWVGLIGAIILGPRLGRFNNKGKPKDFKSYSIGMVLLGTFILWLGWFGFNGGSTLEFNENVSLIILNTILSGSAAGTIAFFHAFWLQKKQAIYEKTIGGILGGLVAITASCNIVTPFGAILIGSLAGIVHNYAFDFVLFKLKVDDPVGAIPVHGFCGAFGTLMLALVAPESALNLPRFEQVLIQLVGIVAAFAWAAGTAFIMFKVIKKLFGLRVSPEEEKEGVSIPGLLKEKEEDTDLDMLAKLMKEGQ